MATQITATTPLSRPAPRLGGREVGILAVIAVAVIGVGAWTQAGSIRDVTIGGQAYDAGYPLHGGLAGPSVVGQVSTLAAPSRALSAVEPRRSVRTGLPASRRPRRAEQSDVGGQPRRSVRTGLPAPWRSRWPEPRRQRGLSPGTASDQPLDGGRDAAAVSLPEWRGSTRRLLISHNA